jgi:hypothetical protein
MVGEYFSFYTDFLEQIFLIFGSLEFIMLWYTRLDCFFLILLSHQWNLPVGVLLIFEEFTWAKFEGAFYTIEHVFPLHKTLPSHAHTNCFLFNLLTTIRPQTFKIGSFLCQIQSILASCLRCFKYCILLLLDIMNIVN